MVGGRGRKLAALDANDPVLESRAGCLIRPELLWAVKSSDLNGILKPFAGCETFDECHLFGSVPVPQNNTLHCFEEIFLLVLI